MGSTTRPGDYRLSAAGVGPSATWPASVGPSLVLKAFATSSVSVIALPRATGTGENLGLFISRSEHLTVALLHRSVPG